MNFRPGTLALLLASAASVSAADPLFSVKLGLRAEETAPAAEDTGLVEQATPFTASLDFQKLRRASQTSMALPIWVESVELIESADKTDVLAPASGRKSSSWRIRLRPVGDMMNELMVRVYADGTALGKPTIIAWNEIGDRVFSESPFTAAEGFASAETVIIPARGVAFIDIEAEGDASGVLAALLTPVQKVTVRKAMDFDALTSVFDPFGNASSGKTETPPQDVHLFDRTRAVIDAETVTLSTRVGETVTYEFTLAEAPGLAVFNFEIANAEVARPPFVAINGEYAGPATLIFPDLADPAYTAARYALDPSPRYRYGGWLRGQILVPGHMLRTGGNELTISAGERAGAVAIRAVEVQLKAQ